MATHSEKGDKSESSDDAGDAKASPPRSKLASIGRILLFSIAPFISIAALGVAVFVMKENHSGEKQLSSTLAKIEGLNASLAASKVELDKLKASVSHDKTAQEEERKKQDERLNKVIQNISPLQLKLKIKPTLEDQLHQELNPAISSGASPLFEKHTQPESKEIDKKLIVEEKKPLQHAAPVEKKAPSHSAPVEHKPVSHTPTAEKTPAAQAKILKDAIEQYNKK